MEGSHRKLSVCTNPFASALLCRRHHDPVISALEERVALWTKYNVSHQEDIQVSPFCAGCCTYAGSTLRLDGQQPHRAELWPAGPQTSSGAHTMCAQHAEAPAQSQQLYSSAGLGCMCSCSPPSPPSEQRRPSAVFLPSCRSCAVSGCYWFDAAANA